MLIYTTLANPPGRLSLSMFNLITGYVSPEQLAKELQMKTQQQQQQQQFNNRSDYKRLILNASVETPKTHTKTEYFTIFQKSDTKQNEKERERKKKIGEI